MIKNKKVFIIEDYEDTLIILKRILKKENLEVETATTGEEAKKKFPLFRPDVIILDINLPDTNGLDLIREFRKVDPDIEIIVLTAYAELENAIRSVRERVSDFIAKPFDTRYLLHSINRCLEVRKLKKQIIRSEKIRLLGEMAAGITHVLTILFLL